MTVQVFYGREIVPADITVGTEVPGPDGETGVIVGSLDLPVLAAIRWPDGTVEVRTASYETRPLLGLG